MDSTIFTSRLKLTLITHVERGSSELKWCHEICTDEKSRWWSIGGRAKTVEDTERIMKFILPVNQTEGKSYRAVYAVHKILDSADQSANTNGIPPPSESEAAPTEFIGLVNVKSLDTFNLPLPEHLTIPASDITLSLETAYMFLPGAWGKGYATESVNACLEVCKQKVSFWAPYEKVYVRALVNSENVPSQRVMQKVGMEKKGVFEWQGKATWLGGRWRTEDSLFIYGKYLIE